MQPFMKNVSVEYAEKAAPGGEIDKSIKELKDIPVLINDNALEILEKKPKFIEYNNIVYTFNEYDEEENALYYSSIYESESKSVYISSDGSITTHSFVLIKTEDAGTKLYKHRLKLPNAVVRDVFQHQGPAFNPMVIISTSPTPYTTTVVASGRYGLPDNGEIIAIINTSNNTNMILNLWVNYGIAIIYASYNQETNMLFDAVGEIEDTVVSL